jgi:hypothetical protein
MFDSFVTHSARTNLLSSDQAWTAKASPSGATSVTLGPSFLSEKVCWECCRPISEDEVSVRISSNRSNPSQHLLSFSSWLSVI